MSSFLPLPPRVKRLQRINLAIFTPHELLALSSHNPPRLRFVQADKAEVLGLLATGEEIVGHWTTN